MSKENQNLKQRLIQALDEFLRLGFAITPLLANIAPYWENWQALKGKNLLPNQQEVLARFETEVGGIG